MPRMYELSEIPKTTYAEYLRHSKDNWEVDEIDFPNPFDQDTNEYLQGWHFLPKDLSISHCFNKSYVDSGDILHVHPPIVLCERGLHGSVRVGQAMKYATSHNLSRCTYAGEGQNEGDKFAAEYKRIDQIKNIEKDLEEFYKWAMILFRDGYKGVYSPFAEMPMEEMLSLREPTPPFQMSTSRRQLQDLVSRYTDALPHDPRTDMLHSLFNPTMLAVGGLLSVSYGNFGRGVYADIVNEQGFLLAGEKAYEKSEKVLDYYRQKRFGRVYNNNGVNGFNLLHNELERRMRELFSLDVNDPLPIKYNFY